MSRWRATFLEIRNAITESARILHSPREFDLQITTSIRSAVSKFDVALAGIEKKHRATRANSSWLNILENLEDRLRVAVAEMPRDFDLENRICHYLEMLVQDLNNVVLRFAPDHHGLAKVWRTARTNVQAESNCIRIETKPTLTDLLNISSRTTRPQLAALKRYVTQNIPEKKKSFAERAARIYASARVNYYFHAIWALPPTRRDVMVRRILAKADPTWFGSLGLAHVGFLAPSHAEEFLRTLPADFLEVTGAVKLIAYVVGVHALPIFSTQLQKNRFLPDHEIADGLRVIGGPEATSMLCSLLARAHVQRYVAQQIVEMAQYCDVPLPLAVPLDPRQSTPDGSNRVDGAFQHFDIHDSAGIVRTAIATLESELLIDPLLASELLAAVEKYIRPKTA